MLSHTTLYHYTISRAYRLMDVSSKGETLARILRNKEGYQLECDKMLHGGRGVKLIIIYAMYYLKDPLNSIDESYSQTNLICQSS